MVEIGILSAFAVSVFQGMGETIINYSLKNIFPSK
jgi:hypothetical protein